MARRVYRRGKYYRLRRGELVQIPPKWVGQTLHPQTKRKRQSKSARKERMCEGPTGRALMKYGGKPGHPRRWAPRHIISCRERQDVWFGWRDA